MCYNLTRYFFAVFSPHTKWAWTFSIYLEAVAIIPQLFLLQKQGECENITSHYVALLGSYRFFYLLNWIYRYFHEYHYSQIIVWVCGVVQTALYMDFFANYFSVSPTY
jgi:ER lumen protein retaining receptor